MILYGTALREHKGKGREEGNGRWTEASSVVDDGGRWPFAGRFILPCARAQNNVKVAVSLTLLVLYTSGLFDIDR
jgi:hypothetical protein